MGISRGSTSDPSTLTKIGGSRVTDQVHPVPEPLACSSVPWALHSRSHRGCLCPGRDDLAAPAGSPAGCRGGGAATAGFLSAGPKDTAPDRGACGAGLSRLWRPQGPAAHWPEPLVPQTRGARSGPRLYEPLLPAAGTCRPGRRGPPGLQRGGRPRGGGRGGGGAGPAERPARRETGGPGPAQDAVR